MRNSKLTLPILLVLLILSVPAVFLFVSCDSDDADDVAEPQREEVLYDSYTVTFDEGNDKIFTSSSDSKTGRVERPQVPSRSGYTFVYWYISADYSAVFDFGTLIESNLTLYAKWAKNLNTLRFEGNGSTFGGMDDMQAETDTVIRLPKNTFFRIGYTFMGWSDTASGTIKNMDAGLFHMTDLSAVTLFARWQANIYNVILDPQNGTPLGESIPIAYDGYLENVPKPEKMGYDFSGYFTQTEGRGTNYTDADMYGINPHKETKDIILYAHWVPAVKTISFNGNGSTGGATADFKTETFAGKELPSCGYSRTGYTFDSWNTEADRSGDSYNAGDTYNVPIDSPKIIVFYAQWSANNYDIVLDDGAGNTVRVAHTYDLAQELQLNSFGKYGYTFAGWNDLPGNLGNAYTDGQEVVNLCSEANGEVTLYVVWSPVTVTVVLNKTGGSGGTNSVDVTFGEIFPQAVAPSKAGYSFGGYFADNESQGEMYYDPYMSQTAPSDIGENDAEIFAKWIPNANILVLEPNDGAGEPIKIQIETGAVVSMQAYTFTKVGYTFIGWNTASDNSGVSYTANADFTVPASDATVKLYAVFAPKPVEVIFEGNDNTGGATLSVNGVSDGVITLPLCGYAKKGYVCSGWSLSTDGSQVYATGAQFVIPATDSGELQLFAHWVLDVYTITYVLGGGTNSAHNPTEYNYLSGNITINNPSRAGFNFTGWTEGASISQGSTGDRIFTANWSIITYTVTYILNGGTNHSSNPGTYNVLSPAIEIQNPNRSGYTFEGWSEGNTIEIGSTGNKTFTAEWNDGDRYTITYELDGGQNGAGNPGSYTLGSLPITLNAPTKDGYTFSDWSPNGVITSGSMGDKTFTANWSIIAYDITYVLDGGTNSADNPTSYTIESEDIFIFDPTKNGYMFDGWQEGTVIESGSMGDKIFTASWTAVSYNLNVFDGINETPNIIPYTIESGEIEIIGVATAVGADCTVITAAETFNYTFTRVGYIFIGWQDSADESVSGLTVTIAANSTGNRYIVAQWEAVEYQISYDLDGGVNHLDNPTVYTVESTDITVNAPTKEGYSFLGWIKDGGSPELLYIITLGMTGDIHLTAAWEIIEYDITYQLDGGTNHADNPDKYTVETPEITFGEPTKEGFTFAGWMDIEGNIVTNIPIGSKGDITLTAQWAQE